MDRYIVLCTELRGSALSLNGNVETLQAKAEKIQKAINKATRGDHNAADLTDAYNAKRALNQSITRLGEICSAMEGAAGKFADASTELNARANLAAYYMENTDTLSYEGLMAAYSSAIVSTGSAVAGYEVVKSALSENGYSVGSLGSVSNAVQDAIQKEAEEAAREAEERAKKAEAAKWVLTGAVIVGGIALSAVTGGAATPVVIGAISGAVMAGGSTAIDEYAEHGWDMDEWDYAEIGKDAFVGGVTGAVTAYIGGNVTKGITNWANGTPVGSSLLNSSNAFARVGTGAAIGSISEMGSGVVTRGTATFITTMVETKFDLGESLSEAVDSAFDGKQMLVDAARGGMQGGKQQYKEWKVAKQSTPEPVIRQLPPNEYEDFAPGASIVKREGRADIYAAGYHYDEYIESENIPGTTKMYKKPKAAYVNARDIEGVNMGEADIKNGSFWTRGNDSAYSREIIYDKAAKIPEVRKQLELGKTLEEIADNNPSLKGTVESYYQTEPVKVYKYKDFYIHADSGRHRTVAGQAVDVEIPVEILGEIFN